MKSLSLGFVLACLVAISPASGQTGLGVTVQSATGVSPVSQGGVVPIQSDGNTLTTVAFFIGNASSANITVNQISVTGSDFSIATAPQLPATIAPNGSTAFTVRYVPFSGTSSTGQVNIQYTEASQTRTFSFGLAGGVPEFSFSLRAADGSTAPIAAGGTVVFPVTRVSAAQSLTLLIRNTGTVPGTLTSATATPAEFSVLPGSLPASIAVGQEFPLQLTFTPQTRGARTGLLTLSLGSRSFAFTLQGTGAAPDFVVAYALRTDGNVLPLTNGSRLTFASTPAQSSAVAEVIILNQGTVPGSVRSVSLSGPNFQLLGLPLLPATLNIGQSLRFSIQFSPPALGSFTGTLRIELEDSTIQATVEGSTAAPQFSLAYIDPASNNVLALSNGSTLVFPNTAVNSSSTYTLIVRNEGPGTGFVNGITATGAAFQVIELPSLPATIEPSGNLRFGIRFSPEQRQRHSGTLRIELSEGSLEAVLDGPGVGPEFTYEQLKPDGSTEPINGSEFSLTSAVGQRTSTTIRFTNRGNADARIDSISITGAGFELANVPFLPLTLRISESQVFTINFTPAQPGISTGRLRIGSENLTIVGNGAGSRLTFAYSSEAGSTPLPEGASIIMSPTRVGDLSRVDVSVRNTGTTAATISTVDVSPNTVFTLEGVPPLPLSLDSEGELRFSLRFAPNTTGNLAATLRINNATFSVSGNGQQPVPLPLEQIQGPSGVQEPMQQPGYTLTLASPYSLPIRGVLTLSFVSEVFAPNPAVQFATGGRTVGFTIPANATTAVFDNGSSEVRLQTGTVAGTITLTPSFATTAGLDITPESVQPLSLTINRMAPRLLSAAIVNRTTRSLDLLITGFSTTRSLQQLAVEISPRGDQRFTTTTLPVNVESAAVIWFQSAQSAGFGGLFSLRLPIGLQRGGASDEDLVAFIQSLSVTARNEVGTSNAVVAVVP